MIDLTVQSFGKEIEYRRAVLTILSFYSHVKEAGKTFLFTDHPEWFSNYLADLDVKFIRLTAEKITSMRGEIDFLHRMKIVMIEETFALTNRNILYADSDSFFTADIKHLTARLSPDKSFMHLKEYTFEFLRDMALPAGESFRAFLALIESKTFKLANGEHITVTSNHASWNAGVMIFHSSHVRFIPDVYALTDQFFPLTRNHASEQYAFSIILQENTSLKPCEEVNYHYWYRIKKQVIDQFLEKNLNKALSGRPLQIRVATVTQWSKNLPDLLAKHELILADNSIQAFNKNMFLEGYKWAIKALLKNPFNSLSFYTDIAYHTKRLFFNN